VHPKVVSLSRATARTRLCTHDAREWLHVKHDLPTGCQACNRLVRPLRRFAISMYVEAPCSSRPCSRGHQASCASHPHVCSRYHCCRERRERVRTRALHEVASLALTGAQAGTLTSILKPTLTLAEVFFIVRIVMSWDPQLDTGEKLPWAIFYRPTEPVLSVTRKVIKPIGGVDISPIIWTFILSLFNEIVLGPQGILVLIERQGGL
jgi:YggT family protein